jgi:Rrf2 family transcriptional repressor of oqxAB
MLDLRFPTALQMMLSLALAEEDGVRTVVSAQLADGLGANPSFVRKLLVPLVQADLVVSSMGRNGGVRLARSAEQITLRDVYSAVTGDKKLLAPRKDVPHRCLVSANVERFFEALAEDAEDSMLRTLGDRSLASSLSELRTLEVERRGKTAQDIAKASAGN